MTSYFLHFIYYCSLLVFTLILAGILSIFLSALMFYWFLRIYHLFLSACHLCKVWLQIKVKHSCQIKRKKKKKNRFRRSGNPRSRSITRAPYQNVLQHFNIWTRLRLPARRNCIIWKLRAKKSLWGLIKPPCMTGKTGVTSRCPRLDMWLVALLSWLSFGGCRRKCVSDRHVKLAHS